MQLFLNASPSIPQWKKRVFIFEAIYANLIYFNNKKNIFENIYNFEDWGDSEKLIYSEYIKNKNKYLKEIELLLNNNWTLDRVDILSLSLLLQAISEYHTLGTDFKILIQQSIITSKKYCVENQYKFINALLNKYFNSLNN